MSIISGCLSSSLKGYVRLFNNCTIPHSLLTPDQDDTEMAPLNVILVLPSILSTTIWFFLRIVCLFVCLFIFRGEERMKKERERNINVRETHTSVASHTPPTGDLAYNPGMCTDQESSQQPFSSQANTQSTEAPQPGPRHLYFKSG